jgi:hypothetical protein
LTGYAGQITTLRVDLNRLRGNSIVTRRDFVEGGSGALPNLSLGEVVRLLEADGDTYLATVEHLKGPLVYLRVDLDSWTPAIENVRSLSSYAPDLEFGPEVSKPTTAPIPIPA